MNFLNNLINKARELYNFKTIVIDDDNDEYDIVKGKMNSLFGELQFVENEINEIKKIIDNE